MPQAPAHLQERWISDDKAIRFLKERGWRLERDWCWTMPANDYQPSEDEFSAVDFLILEWDFGGIVHDERDGTENLL